MQSCIISACAPSVLEKGLAAPIFIMLEEKNSLVCLFQNPIKIKCGGTKLRIQSLCPCKIMAEQLFFFHVRRLRIKIAKYSQKKKVTAASLSTLVQLA